MAKLDEGKTRNDRRKFEKDAAKALAKLAHVLMIDYMRGWNDSTKENIRLAEKILENAYMLHRSVPLAHIAESKIREVRGDLKGAIHALDEALALDDGLADAYAHKVNALILLWKPEEALKVLETAKKLGRGDPEPGLLDWFEGRVYFLMGAFAKSKNDDEEFRKRLNESIVSLNKSAKDRPETWFTWAHLISAYALTGRLNNPGRDVQNAVDKYRAEFQAHWPLEKIEAYYQQPKYRGESPELQAALEEYLSGLKIAHDTAGVEVP
jgi:hypothetical protein